MNVTAVFDIGKTNKKFYLFDQSLKEVYCEYQNFDELKDDDGYPCDDLEGIVSWMKETLNTHLKSVEFKITKVNVSSYGASLVHIKKEGSLATPFYNYLKSLPEDFITKLKEKTGDINLLQQQSGCNFEGLLNSGLQLLYLKHYKPELFDQIETTIHLPQYLVYKLTGQKFTEYTSIGCHTMLWNYESKSYHNWVKQEAVEHLFPAIVPTNHKFTTSYEGHEIQFGVGVHDSSAALIPYLRYEEKPFVLVSTGTWSVTLNPFFQEKITKDGSVYYLKEDGRPVRATKFLLGKIYEDIIHQLISSFELKYIEGSVFGLKKTIYDETITNYQTYFNIEIEDYNENKQYDLSSFESFHEAYHQLVIELAHFQIKYIEKAIASTKIDHIYIDGGFAKNDVFIHHLKQHFGPEKIKLTNSPIGSALGAATILYEPSKVAQTLEEFFNYNPDLFF